MGRRIDVVEYDPQWVAAFEMEAAMLARIFGQRAHIHHIGSTSVPGLAAKPIIDILIVLDHTNDIDSFNPSMEALGYRVRGEGLTRPSLERLGDSISARTLMAFALITCTFARKDTATFWTNSLFEIICVQMKV